MWISLNIYAYYADNNHNSVSVRKSRKHTITHVWLYCLSYNGGVRLKISDKYHAKVEHVTMETKQTMLLIKGLKKETWYGLRLSRFIALKEKSECRIGKTINVLEHAHAKVML